MRSLRRIADSGIAVVATIHQPSVAIFNSFDSLLLLKRGGETVFFGELGGTLLSQLFIVAMYPIALSRKLTCHCSNHVNSFKTRRELQLDRILGDLPGNHAH